MVAKPIYGSCYNHLLKENKVGRYIPSPLLESPGSSESDSSKNFPRRSDLRYHEGGRALQGVVSAYGNVSNNSLTTPLRTLGRMSSRSSSNFACISACFPETICWNRRSISFFFLSQVSYSFGNRFLRPNAVIKGFIDPLLSLLGSHKISFPLKRRLYSDVDLGLSINKTYQRSLICSAL